MPDEVKAAFGSNKTCCKPHTKRYNKNPLKRAWAQQLLPAAAVAAAGASKMPEIISWKEQLPLEMVGKS